MKIGNSVIERGKLSRVKLSEEEIRKEELKDEIKTVLFNKKIEKICRLSLDKMENKSDIKSRW